MRMSRLFAIGFALMFTTAARADLIETSSPDGSGINDLGGPDTTTYGEVFTVPTGGYTQLNSFSFYIDGTVQELYAGVAPWTGTGAGSDLFTSAPFSGTFGSFKNSGPYKQITIDTGALGPTAGQEYVAYFSSAGISGDSGGDFMEMGSGASNADGFAYDNSSGGSPNHSN